MEKLFLNLLFASCLLFCCNSCSTSNKESDFIALPVDSQSRPWTWWWWHGSAVSKENITAELEEFHKSGIGGVTIVCLLDVKGQDVQRLQYLSPQWVEAIVHAKHEARRLGMDVDMSPVYGWAFGGPWVQEAESSTLVDIRQWSKDDIALNKEDLPYLNALVVVDSKGESTDLTQKIKSESMPADKNKWPQGIYYAVFGRHGGSRVRMPGPGGDGLVVDHLSAKAVENYFKPFDKAFENLEANSLPRAFNNDSWEINLNWTPGFFDEFEKRRGYDLRMYLRAFAGLDTQELVSRVACDYRQTLSDLMFDEFTKTFYKWSHSHGSLTTGEAHDEPGNELDFNILYDIPQADMGGPRSWFVKNGNPAPDFFFRRCKIPASVAHILGKPLISSETLTCMGPILDTPLEDVKEKVDLDMIAGINHAMFHGVTYSPVSEPWPGRLFYAGTHLGRFNPMWQQQGKHLNDYITRCQSFLQSGRPNPDVLVYYPIFDLWSQRQSGNLSAPGIMPMDAGPQVAEELWKQGVDFDFVSDRLLDSLSVKQGQFEAPGASYRALVVSGCALMPDQTLERIVELAEAGAKIIFHGSLPSDVPGLNQLDQRRAQFKTALAKIEAARGNGTGKLGKGQILFGDDINVCVQQSGIQREAMNDTGLRFIRRKNNEGAFYFIVNGAENKRIDGWVPFSSQGKSAILFDPMTGKAGKAGLRQEADGSLSVYLQLNPRESCIVQIYDNETDIQDQWTYLAPNGPAFELNGKWEITFFDGGEIIPQPEITDMLVPWTQLASKQAGILGAFSGRARYAISFRTPTVDTDTWIIDLGKVYHTASISLNGKMIGNLFSAPMRVEAGTLIKGEDNLLEIEVANAPINRAAELDIKGIDWQRTIGEDARTFIVGDFLYPWTKKDASWVPRPSGLAGPVQLIPMKYQDVILFSKNRR